MDAGNAQVEVFLIVALVQVERAPGVEDVELGAHEQLHAVHLAGDDVHVAEIDGRAGAGNGGRVLRDAEDLDALVGGGACHLLYGAVGVTARHGVGVRVNQCFHIRFCAKRMQRYGK